MNKQKFLGYIMFGIGFFIILLNAVSYIFKLNGTSPSILILGIIFVVIGMVNVRKSNK